MLKVVLTKVNIIPHLKHTLLFLQGGSVCKVSYPNALFLLIYSVDKVRCIN